MNKTFLRGARLIDGINKPVNNKVIVLEGERIVSVSSMAKAKVPGANDSVFELNGKVVMPGMAAAHNHPAYNNVNSC